MSRLQGHVHVLDPGICRPFYPLYPTWGTISLRYPLDINSRETYIEFALALFRYYPESHNPVREG